MEKIIGRLRLGMLAPNLGNKTPIERFERSVKVFATNLNY